VTPRGAGVVRIIGGVWKRSKLPVPDKPGLRPTPDRVRETLFNWLGQDLTGWRCVDAFAGSGALGFEAASRGAREVRMFELDKTLAAGLRAQAQRFGGSQIQVNATNALTALAQCPPGVWDAVFLDPPFGAPEVEGQPSIFRQALVLALPLLGPQGWLYLEAPRAWADDELHPLGLRLVRHLKAGTVHGHLMQPLPNTGGGRG
jgi:16S rRNA (guanine966-N2)-methyltransferase